MDKGLIGLLIALIAVAGGLGLPFFVIHYQNRERRALIEKGMDPNLVFPWVRAGQKNPRALSSQPSANGPLVWGCLLAGIGTGILTGYFVAHATGLDHTILINGTAVLFGGISLLIYYAYWKKHARKNGD